MTNKEIKTALIAKLGETAFQAEFNHYRSFGWTVAQTLAYMLEINTPRTFEEAMTEAWC